MAYAMVKMLTVAATYISIVCIVVLTGVFIFLEKAFSGTTISPTSA